jgi:hypothetical protein
MIVCGKCGTRSGESDFRCGECGEYLYQYRPKVRGELGVPAIAILASVLLGIGAFLPWVSLGIFSQSAAESPDAPFILGGTALALVLAIAAIFKPVPRLLRLVLRLVGFMVIAEIYFDISDIKKRSGDILHVTNDLIHTVLPNIDSITVEDMIGSGMYLSSAAAITLVILGFLPYPRRLRGNWAASFVADIVSVGVVVCAVALTNQALWSKVLHSATLGHPVAGVPISPGSRQTPASRIPQSSEGSASSGGDSSKSSWLRKESALMVCSNTKYAYVSDTYIHENTGDTLTNLDRLAFPPATVDYQDEGVPVGIVAVRLSDPTTSLFARFYTPYGSIYYLKQMTPELRDLFKDSPASQSIFARTKAGVGLGDSINKVTEKFGRGRPWAECGNMVVGYAWAKQSGDQYIQYEYDRSGTIVDIQAGYAEGAAHHKWEM